MNKTWIPITIALLTLILAFIFFIYPGYYLMPRYIFSTPIPPSESMFPPPMTSMAPFPSTMTPPPSYSYTPSYSDSSTPSPGDENGEEGDSDEDLEEEVEEEGKDALDEVGSAVEEIFYGFGARTETIENIQENVALPVLGTSAAAVALGFVLTPFLSLFFNFPFKDLGFFIFSYFLESLGLFARRRPWGVVYDSVTKKPISGAVVKILESGGEKVRETRVSDSQGRFGFLVDKGIYQIIVRKEGYIFPSKKINLNDKGSDGFYPHAYLGGNVKMKVGFLGLNIPVDMKKAVEVKNSYMIFLKTIKFFERIRLPLLIFGTVLVAINLIFFHSVVDFVILGLYVFLWFLELYNRRKAKPWGEVKDAYGDPLDLAVVRFFNAENSKLITTAITNKKGRFYVLLPAGEYYYTAIRGGYRFNKSKNFKISKIKKPPAIKVTLEKA